MKIMKHMRMIYGFGDMIKHSTLYFMLSMIGQTLFGPYLIMQQGALLSAAFISVYMLMGQVVSIMIPYFEHIKFRASCKLLVIKSWSNMLLPLLLFISPLAFLYGILAWSLVGQITSSIFGINYDDYISRGEKGRFKQIQVMERVNFAAVGIVSGGISMVLYITIDSFELDVSYILYPVILVQFMTAVYVTWIYNKYWSELEEED